MTSFWINDPLILFNKDHITEIWPNNDMSQNEKLNSITRIIIILTLLGYLITSNINIVLSGVITIFVIVIFNHYNKGNNEGFKPNESSKNTKTKNKDDIDKYNKIKPDNPMGNVLITEINDNPTRKPAPMAYTKKIEKKITEVTKKMVKNVNEDYPNIDKKLFRDLGDNYNFDESMIHFHTNPSTTIPNDQGGFANYCYGNMPSCKEGNEFACAKKNLRYINY